MPDATTTDATTATTADATTPTTATTTTETDWRQALPVELRAEKSLAQIKDVSSLAKGYVEAQRMIGGSIRLPKPDAKPEEKAKLFRETMAKFGMPESADKYTYTKPDLPDGAWSDELASSFLAMAHAAGLTNEQVNMLIAWNADLVKAGITAKDNSYAATEKTLRQKWGGTYDQQIAIAQRAARDVGGEALINKLASSGLDNDPDVLSFLAAVGKAFAEDGIISGEVKGVTGKQEALQKIAEINAKKDHPYWKGDPDAMAEVTKLHEIAYGKKPILTIN
ncbi:MAG: hypothetical protein ABFD60_07855 [Bryobacteraceae bacterium]